MDEGKFIDEVAYTHAIRSGNCVCKSVLPLEKLVHLATINFFVQMLKISVTSTGLRNLPKIF